MNYLWTIQKKQVLDKINKDGCYYPDFNCKSNYNSAYGMILDSYNNINNSSYKGLIFCFAKRGFNQYFNDIQELYSYFLNNPAITAAFNFWDNNYVILKLHYSEKFNMIPIDFNDFIYTMPPIYNEQIFECICSSIKKGIYPGTVVLPSFTQVHAPYIKQENIINIYGNFDKKESDRTKKTIIFDL